MCRQHTKGAFGVVHVLHVRVQHDGAAHGSGCHRQERLRHRQHRVLLPQPHGLAEYQGANGAKSGQDQAAGGAGQAPSRIEGTFFIVFFLYEASRKCSPSNDESLFIWI